MTRDLIAMAELDRGDIETICHLSQRPATATELAGVGVALVFEHPSLRTRAASATAVHALGGFTTTFTGAEVGLDERERAEDVARTLLATNAIAALRVRDHGVFARMHAATRGELRLINLLSNVEHPTEAIADVLTLADHFCDGRVAQLAGLTVTYLGDANNVTRSLAHALVPLGVHVRVAAPAGHQVDDQTAVAVAAHADRGGTLELRDDPVAAVAGADALYTDVWVSMGAANADDTVERLAPFRITSDLLAHASPRAVVMHCLPAHRGEEIDADVLESSASVIWQQVRHRTTAMVGALRWVRGEGQ